MSKAKTSDKNSLSSRMKGYEECYDIRIPARSYIIVRLDGKNFSKYTKMFDKPWDKRLSDVMDMATRELCEYLLPKFAYTQSDEISLMFTDIENVNSDTIFDGKVQKLASIAASKLTASFNKLMLRNLAIYNNPDDLLNKIITGSLKETEAVFDARVFILTDFREVSNYFVWRNQDCVRNSITMAASSVFSHKELHGKSGNEKQAMLLTKDINWNDYNPKFKRGSIIKKEQFILETSKVEGVTRKKWVIVDYSLEEIQSLIPSVYTFSQTAR